MEERHRAQAGGAAFGFLTGLGSVGESAPELDVRNVTANNLASYTGMLPERGTLWIGLADWAAGALLLATVVFGFVAVRRRSCWR
jgi:hypothetical protein